MWQLQVVQSRPLSGKDAKKLKRDVTEQFPMLSEEDLLLLLPGKGDITVLKLSNKAVAYAGPSSNPLFFAPTGEMAKEKRSASSQACMFQSVYIPHTCCVTVAGRDEMLVPTVYCLWACPNMLQPLFTYSEVSPKVLGGADLFLQGLIVPSCGLGELVAGEVRTISIPGNRYPFAGTQMQPGHAASTSCSQAGCMGMPSYLAHSCWLGRVLKGACRGRGGCQAAMTLLTEALCSCRAGRCALCHRCCCRSLVGDGCRIAAAWLRTRIASERQREHPTRHPPVSDAAGFAADVWPAAVGPQLPD